MQLAAAQYASNHHSRRLPNVATITPMSVSSSYSLGDIPPRRPSFTSSTSPTPISIPLTLPLSSSFLSGIVEGAISPITTSAQVSEDESLLKLCYRQVPSIYFMPSSSFSLANTNFFALSTDSGNGLTKSNRTLTGLGITDSSKPDKVSVSVGLDDTPGSAIALRNTLMALLPLPELLTQYLDMVEVW